MIFLTYLQESLPRVQKIAIHFFVWILRCGSHSFLFVTLQFTAPPDNPFQSSVALGLLLFLLAGIARFAHRPGLFTRGLRGDRSTAPIESELLLGA